MSRFQRWLQYLLVTGLVVVFFVSLNRLTATIPIQVHIPEEDIIANQYPQLLSWEWAIYLVGITVFVIAVAIWFLRQKSAKSSTWLFFSAWSTLFFYGIGPWLYLYGADWFRIILGQKTPVMRSSSTLYRWFDMLAPRSIEYIQNHINVALTQVAALFTGLRLENEFGVVLVWVAILLVLAALFTLSDDHDPPVVFIAALLLNTLAAAVLAVSGMFFDLWRWSFIITGLTFLVSVGVFGGPWSVLFPSAFLVSMGLLFGLLRTVSPNSEHAQWIIWLKPAILLIYLGFTVIAICRRDERFRQAVQRRRLAFKAMTLPRISLTAPFAMPEINIPLLGAAIQVIARLAIGIYNALVATLQIIVNGTLNAFEKLINLLKRVIVWVLNLITSIALHLLHSIRLLPRILRSLLAVILDVMENPLRYVFLQVFIFSVLIIGINATIFLAIEYFFVDGTRHLASTIVGVFLITVATVGSFSISEGTSFGALLEDLIDRITAIFPYALISFCVLSWALIFITPLIGLRHFRAGPLTWGSTGLIGLGMVYVFANALWQKTVARES